MVEATTTKSDNRQGAEGWQIHDQALVIDTQGVAILLPSVHIPPMTEGGRPYLDRAIASGLTAMNVTLGFGGISSGVDSFRALLNSIYGHLVYFDLHPDKLVHIQTTSDIRRAKDERKLGIIFGVQGFGTKMERDLTLIRILHKLGMRIIQLTNNETNDFGGGCLDGQETGVTQMGRAAITEMNRVGIVVDLAHAGDRLVRDAIDASRHPCLISHANIRALSDHWRNVTDEVLRALAARGGVVGITAYSSFVRKPGDSHPTIDTFVDHIAYVADLVGIDHVGIGSDFYEVESEIRYADFAAHYPNVHGGFDRDSLYVSGLGTVDDLPRLTETLLKRGFSAADVGKVLGGNHFRLFSEIWRP